MLARYDDRHSTDRNDEALVLKKLNHLSKIKSVTGLKRILSSKKRKKVVFTNGVFDILHPGHVQYLEKAKKKGDLLVIALNADSSVKQNKGPKRPINSLKQRQAVIAGLESVDYVTSFSEKTPLKIIETLRPHVLVKGGDWKISDIVGSKEVKSWGGKVFSISFLKGHSTTGIIKKAGI